MIHEGRAVVGKGEVSKETIYEFKFFGHEAIRSRSSVSIICWNIHERSRLISIWIKRQMSQKLQRIWIQYRRGGLHASSEHIQKEKDIYSWIPATKVDKTRDPRDATSLFNFHGFFVRIIRESLSRFQWLVACWITFTTV